MNEPNLLVICLSAFVAVTFLLGGLAGVIRLLTMVFPAPPASAPSGGSPPGGSGAGSEAEGAVVAAISAAAAATYPHLRVTGIQENR